MFRISRFLIPFLLLFLLLPMVCFSASSQQVTASQLVGLWALHGTARKIDGDINRENQTWEFRSDGTLKSVALDRRADGEITLTVKYKIENNMLYVQRAGSKTRWNRFQVVKVADDQLILKGGIEGYMFFNRKR